MRASYDRLPLTSLSGCTAGCTRSPAASVRCCSSQCSSSSHDPTRCSARAPSTLSPSVSSRARPHVDSLVIHSYGGDRHSLPPLTSSYLSLSPRVWRCVGTILIGVLCVVMAFLFVLYGSLLMRKVSGATRTGAGHSSSSSSSGGPSELTELARTVVVLVLMTCFVYRQINQTKRQGGGKVNRSA